MFFSETDLIAGIASRAKYPSSVVKGIGDDTAVLKSADPDKYQLFTQDSIVLNQHFFLKDDPQAIGWKAYARNVSDIAAMGGIPSCALVALGLPKSLDEGWVTRLYDGIFSCADTFSCPVVGGDITAVVNELFVSVSMIGVVSKQKLCLRNGAKPGNMVCVTGLLGGSIRSKHLNFMPRLREAQWLVNNVHITSMIDLSDGLAKDLFHIGEASSVGFELNKSEIPISSDAVSLAAETGKAPIWHALNDGEDFELLFTVADNESDLKSVFAEFQDLFGFRCSVIGRVTDQAGGAFIVDEKNRRGQLFPGGFDHFA
ncbi:MAG: thiamine-phosphate kinase [Candidatus Auribacterota bacterium]